MIARSPEPVNPLIQNTKAGWPELTPEARGGEEPTTNLLPARARRRGRCAGKVLALSRCEQVD